MFQGIPTRKEDSLPSAALRCPRLPPAAIIEAMCTGESRKRARRTPFVSPLALIDATVASPKADRPTAPEAAAAAACIAAMQAADKAGLQPPLLGPKADAPKPSVVACALALYFGQTFGSDRKAKLEFGIGHSTNVKENWVEGKLPRLFQHSPEAATAAQSCFKPVATGAIAAVPEAVLAPLVDSEPADAASLPLAVADAVPSDNAHHRFEKGNGFEEAYSRDEETIPDLDAFEAKMANVASDREKATQALLAGLESDNKELSEENNDLRAIVYQLQTDLQHVYESWSEMHLVASCLGWDGQCNYDFAKRACAFDFTDELPTHPGSLGHFAHMSISELRDHLAHKRCLL